MGRPKLENALKRIMKSGLWHKEQNVVIDSMHIMLMDYGNNEDISAALCSEELEIRDAERKAKLPWFQTVSASTFALEYMVNILNVYRAVGEDAITVVSSKEDFPIEIVGMKTGVTFLLAPRITDDFDDTSATKILKERRRLRRNYMKRQRYKRKKYDDKVRDKDDKD